MDKKMIIISVFFIVMLLLGCAVNQPINEPEVSHAQVEETQESAPQAETETAPEVAEEQEPASAPEEQEDTTDYSFESLPKDQQRKIKMIRSLLEEARTTEENYFFRYSSPGVLQIDVWVKGDILKRSILRADELDKTRTYNMVYLNRKTLKAEGYCETSKSKCWEGKGPFPETFSKWNIKTPKDWIVELGDDFTWALDNKISDQLYHIIDYNQPSRIVRVYVNDYKGWPGRVEIYPSGSKMNSISNTAAIEVYLYDDMDIGGVSDDDVMP